MNSGVDEELLENDVHYGIADCRRRLRSRRSTLRTQNIPPTYKLDEPVPQAQVESEEREEALIT